MEPINQGYAPPPVVPTISAAAPLVRAAAVSATLSACQLPAQPRAVLNQADVPCCVSCALAGAMEILHPDWPPLAPLFHYFVTRHDNRGADSFGFLFLDAALLTLTNQGICKLASHSPPFTLEGAAVRPSSPAFADAMGRRLVRQGLRFRYQPLVGGSRVALIREQIRAGHPVVIGLTLPLGYPESFLDANQEWLDPLSPARSASHHCVLVRGYRDARQTLRIQDSRGNFPRFDNGCWWMGYRVADSSIIQEAYSLF
jgi:hypothetical protein